MLRVRASGGMLPKGVSAHLYTPLVCRLRWVELDHEMLQAYAAFTAYEARPAGSPLSPSLPSPPREAWGGAGGEEVDGESGDSDGEIDGIVDVSLLRAQMLCKATGSNPIPKKATGGDLMPKKPSDSDPNKPTGSNQMAPIEGDSNQQPTKPRDASLGVSKSEPLVSSQPAGDFSAELVERDFFAAVEAKSAVAPPAARPQHNFPMFKRREEPPQKERSLTSEAELAALQTLAQSDPETKRVVQPLCSLKARVEGLQALLDSTEVETAAKLAEVQSISADMASLKKMASDLSKPAELSAVAPSRCADQGVNLEQACALNHSRRPALVGLDVDAMLASLEANAGTSFDNRDG
ncbi:MAG: hypothetical protein SGPRY_013555 [Prymnesium sp.]